MTTSTLTVPRGLTGTDPMLIDMGPVLEVESRIQEIATVNAVKAPELISAFNMAYAELADMVAKVRYEFNVAKANQERVRAIVLIDRVPGILEEKKLTSGKSPMGSEDIRSAILALDPDYQEAQARVIQIQCVVELLEGKLRAIDKAYMAVKSVSADSSQYRHSPDLSTSQGLTNGFFKDY